MKMKFLILFRYNIGIIILKIYFKQNFINAKQRTRNMVKSIDRRNLKKLSILRIILTTIKYLYFLL